MLTVQTLHTNTVHFSMATYQFSSSEVPHSWNNPASCRI